MQAVEHETNHQGADEAAPENGNGSGHPLGHASVPLSDVIIGRVSHELSVVRENIANVLRDRVIGDNAEEKQAAIVLAEGPRWFAPDRPIHIVHSDASMFMGGMRALLLQTLHPLAMAGVAQHSDYRTDPWGRLQRTADFLAATTFGPEDVAQHAVDRVRAVHARVTGFASDGRPYSAGDPHLLRWVHVAEVDSFLTAHRIYGATRLTEQQYDGYVEDMAFIARKLGVPAPPTSVQGLKDQLNHFRRELHATAEARDAVKYLLLDPPLNAAGRVPYALIASGAVATLPGWARSMLRLPYVPLVDKFAAQPLGQAITGIIRWATSANVTYQTSPTSH